MNHAPHHGRRGSATHVFSAAIIATVLAASAPAAFAANQSDFQIAYTAAQQAEQQAAALRDRWTPTEAALKAAKHAAEAGKYDEATALAHEAEALAELSIQQAQSQETAWRDAVVR